MADSGRVLGDRASGELAENGPHLRRGDIPRRIVEAILVMWLKMAAA